MRKIYGTLGMLGLVGVTAAAMVLQACANNSQTGRSVNRNYGLGVYGQTQPTAPQHWSPVGEPQDSPGLSVQISGNEKMRSGLVLGPDDRDVPRIDLQQALQRSEGGGGSGQSPFRDEPHVRSNTQANIDAFLEANPRGDQGAAPHLMESRNSTREQMEREIEAYRAEVARRQAELPPPKTEITLRPGQELWVIERTHPKIVQPADDEPGCGSLMTRREEGGNWRNVPVPLAHTSVSAHVDGYISTVKVTQKFHNPYDSKIEALYVFPLPEDAAVNDFLMTVGSRTIRGVIREREQAEKIYENARRRGYVASIMTQDRPNIFTQAVANIEPGKEIDIDINYYHCLPYRDGAFEFTFPMVVGPRFNPPATTITGSGIGVIAFGNQPGTSGQQTELAYLRPSQRSGSEISMSVDINAGVSIESLESPSHAITVEHDKASPALARVKIAQSDTIPNKDFVLRYRVAGSATKSAMLVQQDKTGGFFSMLLVPPSDLSYIERGPTEVVFLIDCSGSMEGEPLDQAKAAVVHTLARLDVDDTFQIINFSDTASEIGEEPLKATRHNLEKGLSYVRNLKAGGGTMMLNGVKAALNMRRDRSRTRFVCFLTDGFIGNDPEVLGFVRENLGESRIMTVGMGSSPNRYLLEGLARMGRGASAFLNPGDKPGEIMELFLDRISHPALCDLSIDWAGMDVSDVFPKRLPDLYVGRPVMITGRCKGNADGPIKISGRAGRERLPTAITVKTDDRPEASAKLNTIWARKKIEELTDKATSDNGPRLMDQIKQLSLDYGLMSSYTAFIAVDSMTRTAGTFGTTVQQPVPIPAGTRYDTVTGSR